MNKTLQRHHERIAKIERIEMAMIVISTAACAAVFLGFGLISALAGA